MSIRTLSRSALSGLALLMAAGPVVAGELAPSAQDQLWLHRNLGAAYRANEAHAEAAVELAEALKLNPDGAEDARNAGVAALLSGDLAGAREILERAASLDPTSPRTAYALGILQKREADLPGAWTTLLRCRELGGEGPELHYNLGILAIRLRDPESSRREFEAILNLGENHAPRHYASALYRYGRALLQMKLREEGARALREYQELVKTGRGAELNEEQLEDGELLELATFDRPASIRAAAPLPAFVIDPLPEDGDLRWAESADLDGDGDRDLLVGNGQTIRDLRREADDWLDVTASRGLAGLLGVTMARALDFDNDGQLDLVRAGAGGIHVHPGIEGGWNPPFAVTTISAVTFLPVDFDHEGDVDVLTSSSTGPRLIRNNGDGTFTDVTGESGLSLVGGTIAAVSGDFDDDRDVDLALVTRKGRVTLASNLRGGRFEVLPPMEAFPAGVFDLVTADLDGDGDLDFAAATPRGVLVAENRAPWDFQAASEAPVLAGAILWPPAGGSSLWAEDFDNDGLRDLLIALESGAKLGINEGALQFSGTVEATRPLSAARLHPIAAALIDGDDRIDLVTSRAEAGIARNVGDVGSAVVLVPEGVKNNRDGVGATVELLAGSRYVRADASGGPVHLGLGSGGTIDALRVQWPNGIRQAILDARPGEVTAVLEKAGLVGSCPFLYTWNGERFEYITDILTVTPLGLPFMPGRYVPPDSDETIRVTSDQLAADPDGDLVIQVTEELREVTYVDQVILYAVEHPEEAEVQPNEKFKFPPFPDFRVLVLDDVRPPLRATDHFGRDAAELLRETDDLLVGDLELTRYQGIVEDHALVLDFGKVPPDAPLTLHLAGWFYWTNASVNIALSQDPNHSFIPPRLAVRGFDGSWREWPVEVGFPGGKTKSIPVDLTGAFPSGEAVVRLSTTLRIYWDRALLQIGEPTTAVTTTIHLPDEASLRYRGHSEPILSITGEEPERFDYDVFRTHEVPWDQHPGRYTKYGDVTPLLQEADDMFVVMASGDECTLRWRASHFAPLAPGMTRTYFLVFDGWAKDGDPNTKFSDHVDPLPFHGMSGYPYRADEAYPADEEHQTYLEVWNTREAIRLTRDLAKAASAPGPAEAETLETQ